MDFLDLILLGLATFRLSYLIAKEEGPFHIFDSFRNWVADKALDRPNKFWLSFNDGVSCPYCAGIYAAALFTFLAVYFSSPATNFLIYMLSIAGLQVLLQGIRDQQEEA